jgi:ketosteroid isomerase-like protein
MRPRNLLPVLLIAIGLLGCKSSSSSSSQEDADRAAIASIARSHATAFFAGDIDTIVSIYTDDAIVMPPDAPAAQGREAIRKLFAASMATAKPGQSEFYENYIVEVSGDMGWDSGVSKVKDAAGATVWSGHFLAAWRKKDGNWQTVRDIWTNDPPEPSK